MTRRSALTLIAGAAAGIATGGCLPLDRVLSRYRGRLRADRDLEESIYRGFVDAVVPGLDERRLASSNLTRVFFDPELPFQPFHLDMSAHLCKSAQHHAEDWRFDRLTGPERRQVIRAGLKGGRLVKQLYEGTVFIGQVATYANIYDDFGGCPLVDYDGANSLSSWSEMSYQNAGDLYLAEVTDPTGQPN